MPNGKKRIVALGGLMGITGLWVVFCLIPLSFPYLEQYPGTLKRMRAWIAGARFIAEDGVVLQLHHNDCGPAALKMILAGHGIECRLADLAAGLQLTPQGASMQSLRLVSTQLGVPAKSWRVRPDDLSRVPFPAIAFINNNHFVVIRRLIAPKVLEVDDPALGRLHWPLGAFQRVWSGETLIFDPAWSPL
jgi:hypothetical protein